uniref:Uncharacterized protein n=1 Tax=Octopus bimaculoides TaxID=37653 RepID=A0A0L8IBK1_OCTBM
MSSFCVLSHGNYHIGRSGMTYIDQLSRDVKLQIEELKHVMEDRNIWRERVVSFRASCSK